MTSSSGTTIHVDNIARLDPHRAARTGFPEVIYAPGKTTDDLRSIISTLRDAAVVNVLVSRLEVERFEMLHPFDADAQYYPRARMAVFLPSTLPEARGDIAVVTAGSSDLAVAEEIEVACAHAGSHTTRFADVGVAGLHRLTDILPALNSARVILCLAGMEAALPSVLAGLVSAPVIGVPISAGYGVNAGGWNALHSMLGSCAPGVLVVNIDNGIGAAAAAHRINMLGESTVKGEGGGDE